MKKLRRFLYSIIILSLVVFTITVFVDINRMKNNQPPLFAVDVSSDEAYYDEYIGFGYKVYTNSFCRRVTYLWGNARDMANGTELNLFKVVYFHGCG